MILFDGMKVACVCKGKVMVMLICGDVRGLFPLNNIEKKNG